jgi:hypothetical protein
MNPQWDLSTLVAVGIQSVAIVIALVKTYFTAEDAKKMAEKACEDIRDVAEKALGDAKRIAVDTQERTDILNASLTLHRQHVAEQYVDKPAMREMETRITSAINRVGDQLNTYLSRRSPD